jgi:predicted Zn-ribbon and HTH transcriptional regulator
MNDIWIPIAIILIIYTIAVVVVIVRSARNKGEKMKEKVIKCNVCGHLISENEVECPYCHQIIKKEKS